MRKNGRMFNGLRLLKNPMAKPSNENDSSSLKFKSITKASKEKIDYDFVLSLLSNTPHNINFEDVQKVIKALSKNNCPLNKLTVEKLRKTLPASKLEATRLGKVIGLLIVLRDQSK